MEFTSLQKWKRATDFIELYDDDLDFICDEVYRQDDFGCIPVHWIVKKRGPVELLNLILKKSEDWMHPYNPPPILTSPIS